MGTVGGALLGARLQVVSVAYPGRDEPVKTLKANPKDPFLRTLVQRPTKRPREVAFKHFERRLAPAARVVRRKCDEADVVR